ncbi:MAG: PEP-CTERM sorting domain-containing protein, partial [Planctomycetes bacterium]|nr:PEP-CTERM sorting domain-containing protein [Planctomycetota bacterium]
WPTDVMQVDIPNRPQALPYKDIQVQIEWTSVDQGARPQVYEYDSGAQATILAEWPLEDTNEQPPYGDKWMFTAYLVHIEPNPPYERVVIAGPAMIDEITIDTICIPEPATVGLLALGMLGLMLRRHRKNAK